MTFQNIGGTITPMTSCNVPQDLNLHAHIKLHIIEKVGLEMNIENIKYMDSNYITKKW